MSVSSALARRAMAGNPLFAQGKTPLPPPLLGRVPPKTDPASIPRGVSPALVARRISRQKQIPSLALMILSRHMGTEPHRPDSSSSIPGAPPPGFSAEHARRPLPKDSSSSSSPDSANAAAKKQTADAAVAKDDAAAVAAARQQTSTAEGAAARKHESAAAAAATAAADGAEVARVKKDEEKKLTVWQKVKKEAQHYWDGTKLLATEVKISWRLALKMAAGYDLSRRENRQLQRTVKDLARLVPFSVFIIVPLGEALLPLALKLWPNMLPSTYEGQKSREKKATLLRSTRKEVSGFLRQTLREGGLPLSPATAQKEEFTNFFRKVRSTGEAPTHQDVIKVCKVFRDDMTLDNLSRPQLVSMCRYMNLNTFGTDSMLRYQVRHRMRQIKRDDKAISFEGVDSLTVGELQLACAARGIRTHSVSPARMRADLQSWLDLRLAEGVPSTLLVLSNAYMYGQGSGEGSSQLEALIGVLSSIPEELFHEIELEVHNAEGAATNKQRLEVLKEQEELIEEENEQNEESQSTGFATPRDVEDIDEKEDRQAASSASESASASDSASASAPDAAAKSSKDEQK